jgi:hypothetical protein
LFYVGGRESEIGGISEGIVNIIKRCAPYLEVLECVLHVELSPGVGGHKALPDTTGGLGGVEGGESVDWDA